MKKTMASVMIFAAATGALTSHGEAHPATKAYDAGRCDSAIYTQSSKANVILRIRPSQNASVSHSLEQKLYDGEDYYQPIDLSIATIQNGWLLVSKFPEGDVAAPLGWIHGSDTAFVIQTELGFSKPSAESKITYEDPSWIFPSDVVQFMDCQGEWLKLKVKHPKQDNRTVTAWFRGVCLNHETTCDSKMGDRIASHK